MYANLDVKGFIKSLTIDSAKGLVRIGRDAAGIIDYICIWNLDTPGCIDFEFVIGRGERWVADREIMLKGFDSFILTKRGLKRRHKIISTKTYGSSK
jgi:hypothetical protein